VPANETTAVNGRWVKGPGEALFNALLDSLGPLPVIAEDLGVITPDVEALRDRFGFPGMKILQFAFDSGPYNSYLPHNYERHAVVYTGTHDNDTTAGWYAALQTKGKERVMAYIGSDGRNVAWDMVRTVLASVADTAVIPLQDILGLGSAGRMNIPGTSTGNWSWRFAHGDLNERLAAKLHDVTEMYGRLPQRRH
jgi:4-alpha-glucanotransferase